MNCKTITLSIVAFILTTLQLTSQNCEQLVNSAVLSDTEKSIILQVDGLLSNNLATTSQGLCEVNISFNHSAVEVMRMNLISPAGTSVSLIGPATVNGTNTQFINWDVSFRPCGIPVSPDDNFSDTWDNANNWAGFSNYSGSYYPTQGCLEDFNSGTANGNWALQVEDLGSPANGFIESVELVFCDPAGLSCRTCEFTIDNYNDTDGFICEGDIYQTMSTATDLNYQSENDQNEEKLILVQNDNILEISDEINLGELGAGTYQICALVSDLFDYNTISNASSLTELRAGINDNNLCAVLTQDCRNVEIDAPQEDKLVQDVRCSGEWFEFNNENLSVPVDTLIFNYQNTIGCVSKNEILVEEIIVVSDIADVFDEISETNTIVTISASSLSTDGDGVTYEWTTNDGSFASATNGPIALVDSEGQYYLTISKDGCSAIDTIDIQAAPVSGSVILSTEDGLCTTDTVQIFVETTLSIESFNWSGPSLVDPTEWEPKVTGPGTYTLTINSPDESEAVVTSIEVLEDPVPAFTINTNNDLITCVDPTAELSTTLTGVNQYDILWTDENGNPLGEGATLEIISGGTYIAVVTNAAGCMDSQMIIVDQMITPHTINITVDPLTCDEMGQLFLTADDDIKNIKWTGPPYTVFDTDVQNPAVFAVGKYTAKVTFEDECVVQKSVDVDYVATAPDVDFGAPIITCYEREVNLAVNPNPNYDYNWRRTNGGWGPFNEINPQTDRGGDYTVTVTDENGCDAVYYFKVNVDTIGAVFTIEAPDIDCNNPSVVLDYNYPENNLESIIWTGPGIDNGNMGEFHPSVSEDGMYTISGITSSNGCDFENSISLNKDIEEINLTNAGATFTVNCKRDKAKLIAKTDRDGDKFKWTLDGVLKGTNDTIRSAQTGEYTLLVTASNGCTDEASYFVEEDKDPPMVTDLSSASINCINNEATIEFEVTDNNGEDQFTFLWTDNTTDTLAQDQLSFISEDEGFFVLHSTNIVNGCSSLDTVFIDADFSLPEFDISSDTLTCTNTEPQIFIDGETTGLNITWTTPDGEVDNEVMIANIWGQDIYLSTSGDNGCVREDTITLAVDTIYPSLDFTFDILGSACDIVNTPVLVSDNVGNANVSYSWWSEDGEVSGDEDSAEIIANGNGYYFVVAENLDNHCVTVDSVLLEANGTMDSAAFEENNPLCNNEPTGSINVLSVVGGSGNYQYSLDEGASFQAAASFTGLTSGNYTLTIIDDSGCELDTLVELEPGNFVTVDPVETIEVDEGETIYIDANADFSGNDAMYEWLSQYITDCGDCDQVELTPFTNETVTVIVTDENGCKDEAQIRIFVTEKSDVFVPNAFSPIASNAQNQVVQPWFAAFVTEVNTFAIYDRWGNQVFVEKNVDPVVETITWDGTMNGNKLPSGVYVMLVEYTKASGQVVTLAQDITLIR